ncbi:LOW QUALITY PROTEIN: hypothetical protein HID58_095256, partial [Brassica napus]
QEKNGERSPTGSDHLFRFRPRFLHFIVSVPRFPRFQNRARIQLFGGDRNSYQYETKYFSQQLDHFSFADLPKFSQRYLINSDHWTGASELGPIFLYCGNEGDIEWFATNSGFIWEIAPKFGALLVFPEHRYYGESMPYGSRDEAYKNATTLSYLTTEQALADFAVFVTDLKRNLSAEASPVVLFGGSYGGMLAAWMRLKYPHIAIGALASSAPILQFEDIVPPQTFYDIVSNDFKRESSTCFNTIKNSWDAIIAEGQKENGLQQLSKTFHFCRALNSTDDLSDWLDSAYSYLAMVDYPYPADFMMPLPGHPIKEVCRKIDGASSDASILERIYAGVGCFELDDDPHGLDGWNWQACTEMVMPMSSSQENSMFTAYDFNYSSYKEDCWNTFGVNPRPRWVTTELGGHDIETALKSFGSNIIFSNGLLDPWSGGKLIQYHCCSCHRRRWTSFGSTTLNSRRPKMASGAARSRDRVDPRVDQNLSIRKRSSISIAKTFLVRERCNTCGKRTFSVKPAMATYSSERLPRTPATTRLAVTPGSRVLKSPLSDEEVMWKRLKEAGDKAALIAYIAKLESEVYDYQHNMGLLILEKDQLLSKYEEVKASVDEADLAHRRDLCICLCLGRIQETRRGFEQGCWDCKRLEKTLHEIRAECAETKVSAGSKMSEAHTMIEDALKKFADAEAKMRAAEALQSEANRYHRIAERKLKEVESRQDDLARRLASFKSESETRENEIVIERQTLKLAELEKGLESAKTTFEEERRALEDKKFSLEIELASLAKREVAVSERESSLLEKEQELLVAEEKIASKESKVLANQEVILRKRKSVVEAELESKCKWRKMKSREETGLGTKRGHDLEVQSRILAEKEKDITERSYSLDEEEKHLNATEEDISRKTNLLENEKERLRKLDSDLQQALISLEDKRKRVDSATEKLEALKNKRITILEMKLKEELDDMRGQKLELLAEADRMKVEKLNLKPKKNGVYHSSKRGFLDVSQGREERDALRNQHKNDVEALNREREEFMNKMVEEHSECLARYSANVLTSCWVSRRRKRAGTRRAGEFSREREKAFEQEKKLEEERIQSLKESAKKDLEHVQVELKRLDAERLEIKLDRERREREWSELKDSVEELKVQREKLETQRHMSIEREKSDTRAEEVGESESYLGKSVCFEAEGCCYSGRGTRLANGISTVSIAKMLKNLKAGKKRRGNASGNDTSEPSSHKKRNMRLPKNLLMKLIPRALRMGPRTNTNWPQPNPKPPPSGMVVLSEIVRS